ncbi:MAG: hypothetical protein SFU25_01035 [Candidatus Caenarcaniphilales bacterium]|nr:hypothetical protein [Candidatus Caenarcaniphilales bacterium]
MATKATEQELTQELTMDPNQDEELKNLSSRTEELLSRLNELSSNLNSQLKFTPSEPISGPPSTVAPPNNLAPNNLPELQEPQLLNNVINAPDGKNYYSIPVNTQYLEKSEKRIHTTELGQNIMTTSSTSIIKEERHFQSTLNQNLVNQTPVEGFVPAHFQERVEFQPLINSDEHRQPINTDFQNQTTQAQPLNQAQTKTPQRPNPQQASQNQNFVDPAFNAGFNPGINPGFNVSQEDFQETPLRERPQSNQRDRNQENSQQRSNSNNIANNIKGIDPDELTRVIGPRKQNPNLQQNRNFRNIPKTNKVSEDAERLQPAAIFSSDQKQTKRAPQRKPINETFNEIDYRTKEIADQLAEKNREIKSRLNKYSKRLQVNGQTDNLRLFAWLILAFSPFVPMALIKDDLILTVACSSLALFFGIFFCMLALRVVEISELVRWAHNQILLLQSKVEEQNNYRD